MARYFLRNSILRENGEKLEAGTVVELTGKEEAVALDFQAAVLVPDQNIVETPKTPQMTNLEAKTPLAPVVSAVSEIKPAIPETKPAETPASVSETEPKK